MALPLPREPHREGLCGEKRVQRVQGVGGQWGRPGEVGQAGGVTEPDTAGDGGEQLPPGSTHTVPFGWQGGGGGVLGPWGCGSRHPHQHPNALPSQG